MARDDLEKRLADKASSRQGKTAKELMEELTEADQEQAEAADEIAGQVQDEARWRPES